MRTVIQCVKARAYALRGDTEACRRQVDAVDAAQAGTGAEPHDGWVGTIATPGQLYAGTGHALATLARRTKSEPALREAQARLSAAAGELDSVGQARAVSLCLAQLAALHLEAGELDEGVSYGNRLLDVGHGIRSSRLTEHLAVVRRSASAFAHEPHVKDLIAELDVRFQSEEA